MKYLKLILFFLLTPTISHSAWKEFHTVNGISYYVDIESKKVLDPTRKLVSIRTKYSRDQKHEKIETRLISCKYNQTSILKNNSYLLKSGNFKDYMGNDAVLKLQSFDPSKDKMLKKLKRLSCLKTII